MEDKEKTRLNVLAYASPYIAFSLNDSDIARMINDRLKEKDFLTYFDADDAPSSDYVMTISREIRKASIEGCVLLLISENSKESMFFERETAYIAKTGGNVVPVIIGNCDFSDSDIYREILSKYPSFHLSGNPDKDEINGLVNDLGKLIISKKE